MARRFLNIEEARAAMSRETQVSFVLWGDPFVYTGRVLWETDGPGAYPEERDPTFVFDGMREDGPTGRFEVLPEQLFVEEE